MQFQDEQLAMLWLIREYQPITVKALITEKLDSKNTKLPQVVREFADNYGTHRDPRVTKYALEALNSLLADRLIVSSASDTFEKRFGMFDWTEDTITLQVANCVPTVLKTLGISLSAYLEQAGERRTAFPIFGTPISKTQNWADVFVIMPFRDELQPVFSEHIKQVTNELTLSCKRGDDFFSANNIMQEVWSSIVHAKICIADCSGRNPNVFYEIGMAHTIGRKTILIAQSMDDVPFDIRHLRIIIYENTNDGLAKFRTTLAATLRSELDL